MLAQRKEQHNQTAPKVAAQQADKECAPVRWRHMFVSEGINFRNRLDKTSDQAFNVLIFSGDIQLHPLPNGISSPWSESRMNLLEFEGHIPCICER